MPFRIQFTTDCIVPLDTWKMQAAENAHWPRVELGKARNRPLAVVGGSPQVLHDLEELRAWPGDIWAINYTAEWLLSHGIESTLFTVDPGGDPNDPGPVNSPVRKRLLATSCPPAMFTEDTLAFDMVETHALGFAGGTCSATRAPFLALSMGYTDVHFFGCEGSFEGADHVDRDECARPELNEVFQRRFIVRAGGRDYITRPDYYVQCIEFVRLFTEFSCVFKNRSGGLLKAMLDYPDTWEVIAVSAGLKAHLEEINGKQGLYEGNPSYPLAAQEPA